MTTFDEARDRVLRHLDDMSKLSGIDLALNEEATQADPWCWVFHYNSRAYLETSEFSDALAGNGPFVIERETGRLHELTTARPVDVQLAELRRRAEALK